MYLQSLSLSQLRCFAEATVDLQYPGRTGDSPEFPNVNLILGNNGAGKTTLLKAISLAVLSPIIESSGFVPYHLVRRYQSHFMESAMIEATILLHPQDTQNNAQSSSGPVKLSLSIKKNHDIEQLRPRLSPAREQTHLWDKMYDNKSSAFLLLGYGANRRVEPSKTFDNSLRSKTRLLRYQRVASLFEEQMTLVPLSRWLPEYKDKDQGRHKQVIHLINRLLPEGTKVQDANEENEYLFKHKGVTIPFSAMSDGYRAYIGWISDLLYHICMGCPPGRKLVESRGIVLVDEIDLHIHPEWQRTVVSRIAKALPLLQFVFTTHSPIIAGMLETVNLYVTESSSRGIARVSQLEEDIHGLNANQILLSSYFSLKSTRAHSVVKTLNDLAKKAQEGDSEASIQFLEQLVHPE